MHMTKDEEREYILANFKETRRGNIALLASGIGRSHGYVFNICKSLGLKYRPDPDEKKVRQREYQKAYNRRIAEQIRNVHTVSNHGRPRRIPVTGGWFPGIGKPRTPYQRMLSECIIFDKTDKNG